MDPSTCMAIISACELLSLACLASTLLGGFAYNLSENQGGMCIPSFSPPLPPHAYTQKANLSHFPPGLWPRRPQLFLPPPSQGPS